MTNQVAGARLWIRKLRLACGLALFYYVTTHLLNHALGNISIPAMEAGMVVQKWIWQGMAGTAILYSALATHYLLGLWALYERRHFGWTATEVVQVVLGMSIPFLLMNHLFVTRISLAVFATEKGYAQELYSFWIGAPLLGMVQLALLIVAWIHGCIGMYQWLRLKPVLDRWMPFLFCTAVLIPVLALLGFFRGGWTMLHLAQDSAWRAANLNPGQIGTPLQNRQLLLWRNWSLGAATTMLIFVLLARLVRAWRERRGAGIRVTYPNGRGVRVPLGFSVLDASKSARIPHANICGGRGRCSTCRIRIFAGSDAIPGPAAGEAAVLRRVGAGPGVRLACQSIPRGDVSVAPTLPANWPLAALHRRDWPMPGEERFIVVLTVDMRNSTRLAETRLPFDAVFIVDRFVTAVGSAVDASGGRVSHFLGDGLMATFGLKCGPSDACLQALTAVIAIGRNIAALNRLLVAEAVDPLRFGIGLHCGSAVVGEIGYGTTRTFTTLGDAANVAARLESLCKETSCEAMISHDVWRIAGLPPEALEGRDVSLRGRSASLRVHPIDRVEQLADLIRMPVQADD